MLAHKEIKRLCSGRKNCEKLEITKRVFEVPKN
jgi:hypothetical protein